MKNADVGLLVAVVQKMSQLADVGGLAKGDLRPSHIDNLYGK